MDYPGQSGHVHQSLVDANGAGQFHDAAAEHNMSALMRQYVAGQQKFLKPFLSLCAPTINSYTRLVKGAWAPTAVAWGVDNRTTALRVITGSEQSQRVEFRIGPADANPYLIAAASLGAGLLGIEQQLDPGEPLTGNAYEQEADFPTERQLATNLRDATRDLAASTEARELFGNEFVDHFIASRDWEVREHERHVTDWQLQRYFEII
jgi:glutamine synthetase